MAITDPKKILELEKLDKGNRTIFFNNYFKCVDSDYFDSSIGSCLAQAPMSNVFWACASLFAEAYSKNILI